MGDGRGRDGARRVVDLALRAVEAYGRPDLAPGLRARREALIADEVLVAVVGGYKHGKSSLVNALAGSEVCPVDDVAATAVPTIVRHGEPASAAALRLAAEGLTREPLAVGAVPAAVVEPGLPGVLAVEVVVPAPGLAGGPALIDTPGVGGLGSAEHRAALALGPAGALFVTDAARELTASDVEHLREVAARCPQVAVVLSRTDLQPAWRAVRDADRRHLDAAGLPLPLFPVATALARRGQESASGFAPLRAWLAAVRDRGAESAAQAAAAEVVAVTDVLAAAFAVERDALLDPAGAEAAAAALVALEARAAALRGAGARWAHVLGERFTTITADADHDLRSRMRELTRIADERVDAADPATAWPELERWLREQLAAEVDGHLATTREASQAGVAAAAAVLELDAPALPDGSPSLDLEGLAPTQPELARPGLFAQGLTLLRGSYGSVLMIGALGGLAGLTVAAPVVAAVGLALGGRSFREDRVRQRAARRAAAKAALRRHVDDVTFVVAKASRDGVRALHGEARALLATAAEQATASIAAELAAVRAAATADGPARELRLRDVEAELARLSGLRERAAALRQAPQGGPA